ncbi:F0F1 ATP synthase subunit B [Mesobaculum littorinae]|uniref:ATP synthase subunit b n=1 Tax=Mesobaculum littorinae TaxID=2486419 RepID=A0A438AED9_9RHOB|nr:F0F1 ATP synthase subunit B [Mesobaculum littorinae]RVV97049.1 F0F1 ATP synthase subunit B [Mesobaculum littorinae]
MKRSLIASTAGLALSAAPAMAATGPFFTMLNTNFVMLIGFIVFIAVLMYFRVPSMLMAMLDRRAAGIRSDLDEARALREEAQTLLASYERKQTEMKEQADRIVAHARDEARASAEAAKADLKDSIARRLQAADEQIASAEAAAVRSVRDRAVQVAVAAAGEVLAKQMDQKRGSDMIDQSIGTVETRLH